MNNKNFLYAFKPKGHGEPSYFVMSKNLERAKSMVKKYLIENNLTPETYNIIDTNYYNIYEIDNDVVIYNDND